MLPLRAVQNAISTSMINYVSLDIAKAEFQGLQIVNWKYLNVRLLRVEDVHKG